MTIEIKIKEQEYLKTHFNNRARILENIEKFMEGKEILEIDKFQDGFKIRDFEFIRKGAVIYFKNGGMLDIRLYKNKFGNEWHISAYASGYSQNSWKWLGCANDDKTVCELIENLIDKLSSLKEELNNKVDNELKRHFGRFYISRG